MKFFVVRFIKFSALFFAIYLLLFTASSGILRTMYSNIFTGFVIDKYNSVTSKQEQKRLILMGGSNTIYSINSQLLEEELGVKVINSGFVFNTGYEFQMNFLKEFSKAGDVVLYIPEFKYYSGNGKLGTNFMNNALLTEPKLFPILGVGNQINYLRSGFKSTMNPIFSYLKKESIPSEIKRTDFNEYGDLIFHLDKKSQLENVRSYAIIKELKISKEFIRDVNQLELYLTEKECQLYITYPVYSKNYISKELLMSTDSLVRNNSLFIGDFKENLYEDEMFYDSPFHALKQARNLYTKNLIKYLKNVI